MWKNDDDSKWLAAAPTSDFSIAYGRPNSQAVVIPIDFASARVTISTPQAGTMFKAELTIPEPVAEDKAVHFFKRKGAPPKAAVLLKIISDNIGKIT